MSDRIYMSSPIAGADEEETFMAQPSAESTSV